MIPTLFQIEPKMLLRDRAGGSVLSFRHRVLDAMDGGVFDVEIAAAGVASQVHDGALSVVSGVEPSIPTCRACGCSESYGCIESGFGIACRLACDGLRTFSMLCTACMRKPSLRGVLIGPYTAGVVAR